MGPLQGLRIVELFCIGPGPFAGMLLSDMGADILRIDRPREPQLGYPDAKYRTLWRNRRAAVLDLAKPAGVEALLRLVEQADGLIEGYRPGVAERLGVGPDVCLARNPRLVYGRMTGWGQDGPLSRQAGFDINYISLTGLLHAIGPTERPVPPLIAAGDFGGGGVFLALGMLAALWEAQRSGRGQVVDASIVDGASNLMAYIYGGLAGGAWLNQRAANTVDGGHWRYAVYECADGRFVSVAAMMEPFLNVLLEKLGLDPREFPEPNSRKNWTLYRERLAAIFRTRPRDEWVAHFAGTDACVAPVLDLEEAPQHSHNRARGTFVEHEGVIQPAPAPRFSRTSSTISRRPPANGENTDEALHDWGFTAEEIQGLRKHGVLG
jgi:alpha-methylacyl-CoA racemase